METTRTPFVDRLSTIVGHTELDLFLFHKRHENRLIDRVICLEGSYLISFDRT